MVHLKYSLDQINSVNSISQMLYLWESDVCSIASATVFSIIYLLLWYLLMFWISFLFYILLFHLRFCLSNCYMLVIFLCIINFFSVFILFLVILMLQLKHFISVCCHSMILLIYELTMLCYGCLLTLLI